MPRIRTLTPGASPTHFFGSEVRRAREAAGMSQAELGALVPCDKSVVSRIEAGLVQADESFARACDVAFPHLDGFFMRFWKDCQTWGAAFPAAFREFAAYEAEAVTIWTFQHSLMPGLFQTEGYARAVLERHPNVTSEQVAERVAARLARQSVLERTDPPLFWVLLDENVLHRHVGSATIMQDQVTHLAAMAQRPNITVQVIPRKGAHVGLMGAFDMAETPDVLMAHVEHISEGMTTDSPAIVALASMRFDALKADAYRRSESLTMIEEMVEKWKP
jgi:transcriptional regulator with XRE-family HTH domain